ncbi:MAG: CoA transferase, partial [Clostridia bacterium]|nr:CoA transferase [Clostridia bacterium]
MTAPLAGIVVLDLSRLLPGPYCSMLLADLGADVIKVEEPGRGDYMREMNPPGFEAVNRNKRSLVLNLKHREGAVLFRRLAARADVVLESFRPGVADRLGVGYEAVRAVNPGVVYCSISGYGQDGPYRDLGGHDLNYLGVAGVLAVSGQPDGPPAPGTAVAVADLCSALFAFGSIVTALFQRSRTGAGQYLDVSMTDAAASWMTRYLAEFELTGGAVGKREWLGRPAYGAFQAADGKFFTVGALEDVFFARLCRALDREDWLTGGRYATYAARAADAPMLNEELARIFRTRPRAEWLALLRAADVPAAPVNDLTELRDDPQLQARGLFLAPDHPAVTRFRHLLFPVRFGAAAPAVRRPAPGRGG